MCKNEKIALGCAALVALASLALPAHADAEILPAGLADASASTMSPASMEPLATAAIDSDALDAMRGGDGDVHLNEIRIDGVVGENSASNLVTGTNSINEGSFAGSNGLPLIVQNSGNNVLIQNATILNLQLQ